MKSQRVARRNLALKFAIVAQGTTQRCLATRTRIEETRLSRIISLQKEPSRVEMRRIARVLKTDVAALFPVEATA